MMPKKPRFMFFAFGENNDLFGYTSKKGKVEYTPKTAIRVPIKNIFSSSRRVK